jgi:hypothetical protein
MDATHRKELTEEQKAKSLERVRQKSEADEMAAAAQCTINHFYKIKEFREMDNDSPIKELVLKMFGSVQTLHGKKMTNYIILRSPKVHTHEWRSDEDGPTRQLYKYCRSKGAYVYLCNWTYPEYTEMHHLYKEGVLSDFLANLRENIFPQAQEPTRKVPFCPREIDIPDRYTDIIHRYESISADGKYWIAK